MNMNIGGCQQHPTNYNTFNDFYMKYCLLLRTVDCVKPLSCYVPIALYLYFSIDLHEPDCTAMTWKMQHVLIF